MLPNRAFNDAALTVLEPHLVGSRGALFSSPHSNRNDNDLYRSRSNMYTWYLSMQMKCAGILRVCDEHVADITLYTYIHTYI